MTYLEHNISRALPNITASLAMIVSAVPINLHLSLATTYGDCEPGGYTDRFLRGCNGIHTCYHDNRLCNAFIEEQDSTKNKRGLPTHKKVPVEARGDNNSVLANKELFAKVESLQEASERKMTDEKVGAYGTAENAILSNIDHKLISDCVKSAARTKKETKVKDAVPAVDACWTSEKNKRIQEKWKEIVRFYYVQGIVASFLWSLRASYWMDMNSVKKAGVDLSVGMEPNQMNAAGLTSGDSENHNKHARNAHLQMTDLVARCIHAALSRELKKEEEGLQDTKEEQPPPQKKERRSNPKQTTRYKLSHLLNNPTDNCHLHTGIIRQGRNPIHQSLHIDNPLIIDNEQASIVNKIYEGEEEVTAAEWLQLGYVVDMPLSQEGSWLRVAVPNPEKKMFIMHWIYIPYGSMLIRSMALLHGGHYGDPGNCRYHGTFTMFDTIIETKILGHIDQMCKSKKMDYSEWGLAWNTNIPPEGYGPDGYRRIKCERWKTAKTRGSFYFHRWVKPQMNHPFGLNILKNLSPGEGLVPEMKKKNLLWSEILN
jgi:hypothetical protein